MATGSAPTGSAQPGSAPRSMAAPSAPNQANVQETDLEGRPASPTTLSWGNSAPLALAAFAVTTFMLSMINAGAVSPAVRPAVLGVALMFGGITQLIAGVIQLRTGNTFSGVLFAGFGGFWMSLFAVVHWFMNAVPAAQAGHALGLFLYAFGIFAAVMWAASFRTNATVVLALGCIMAAFFLLGAGNYGAHTALIHWGGYLGLAGTGGAFYLTLSELCEVSYERTILPVGSLARRQ